MLIYGIDISKGYLDLFSHNQDDDKSFTKRIKNKQGPITRFLESIPDDAILCAEHTGIYGNLLVQLTTCINIKIALVQPFTIKKSMGAPKGKSDRIDAQRIWEYATRFTDKLQFCSPENPALHTLRELVNLRNQLVKQRKMLRTALVANENKVMLSVACYHTTLQTTEFLTQQIKAVENQIMELINSEDELRKTYLLVTSIKGVGLVTAAELMLISDNFSKIDSARKAAAYAGVCPYFNESGSIKQKPKVHPRSDKRLKTLLYLAAVTVCNSNKDFKLYKQRKMAEGKHYFLVMNNIANKLLRLIYAVLRSGVPYDPMYVRSDPRLTEKTC